jgi:hypothetical protein
LPPTSEQFRTLYCDPGEDFGWVTGVGLKLVSGGTEKMWYMADEVWRDLNGQPAITNSVDYLRDDGNEHLLELPIQRIVCEDWRLYPDKLRALAWDQCRTARVIGALTFMARTMQIPFILQPAAIKKQAQAAGAEELYWRPLRENRHQNDAVQHFCYYTQTELLGLKTTSLDNLPGKPEQDA